MAYLSNPLTDFQNLNCIQELQSICRQLWYQGISTMTLKFRCVVSNVSTKRSILAVTTHRMPNILTSVRHTKRHLNYLKLYSHCPENAADSADVFTLSNITPYPEIFPFKPRGVFSLALQGAVLLHRIPFSYWQSTQLKLGCINSRLHWTPCCNLQFFEIHWQCTGILGEILLPRKSQINSDYKWWV